MSIKKPKVTLNLDERCFLGITIFFLVFSVATFVYTAKVNKPLLLIVAFEGLGVCFFFFYNLCKWNKPLSGAKATALLMAGFFLTLSMLAGYGALGAIVLDELIIMAVIGSVCFITFLVFFTLFCVWQKADLE